jgi:IS30 family transposase
MSQPGRPRALDEIKRREVCALVSTGCSVRRAARYVGCAHTTIVREAQQNQDFRDRLRAAEIQAQLHPLRAIRQAAATHWRAAAWWLERTQSGFARRDPDSISTKRVRALFQNLLDVVDKERLANSTRERLRWHILAAMNGTAHKTQTARQTRRALREAIEYFANKERSQDPLQDLIDVDTEVLLELGLDAPKASKAAAPLFSKANGVPRDLHQPTPENTQPAA